MPPVDRTPPDHTPPDRTPPDHTPPDRTPPDHTPPDRTPPDHTPLSPTQASPTQGWRTPFDHTPDEIESREELDAHLGAGTLAGLTVQGLRLDRDFSAELATVDVTGALFVGCRLPTVEAGADLVRRGAFVIPDFPDLPYQVGPSRLYRPEDLAEGFGRHGFDGMLDTVVYRHFVRSGGALPAVREALTQRMHDHGIDNALADALTAWVASGGGPVIGIMGGHAVARGSAGYRAAAAIGNGLAAGGCLVVTGGGPGVMEAANLGAYLARDDRDTLDQVIGTLAAAPRFTDHDLYTKLALEVRAAMPKACRGPLDWATAGGLSVPTWLYGHEPANLFAANIAKYFSNAIREDTILRLSRGGIVFAPGKAGTVQEVFQAATKSFYATDGASGPFVFIGREYWTETLPVATLLTPVLAQSPHGDLADLVRINDDPDEAVEIILSHHAAGAPG
jgi:predicted Rossmann-fold nucleotide-binding protein